MATISEASPTALLAPTIESSPAARGLFSSSRKRNVVLSLLLVLATLALYNGIVHNAFINVDDNGYVTENEHVHAGLTPATLRWALTTFACENWHPLTWVSHALDWQLFGKNAAGHHYMSVLLHALNAVLLFLLLQSATGFTWRSLVVAALFAVHPVNVESVAWAAERKNVLSMMFFLLAMLAYGWYAQRPSVRRYASVAVLFAFALMAKPQVITFPFVLMLWDIWPLRRFRSAANSEDPSRFAPASMRWLIVEKIPLLLLSAGDALLTMRAQHNAVRGAMTGYSLPVRLGNVVVSYTRYVGHAFWPLHLSPAYPHPGGAIPLWQVVASCAFLLSTTALVLASRKGYLLVGWLWFLGILVPMIGIVQVGDQAMADRYAYIPFIGLFWMATWTIAEAGREWQLSSRWLSVPFCLAVAGAAILTPRQVGYWQNSETLWRYALSVTDRNFIAHSYLAAVLTKEERHEEAIVEYAQAEEIHQYPLTEVVYFADYELRHEHVSGAIADARRVLQGTNNRIAREMAYRDLGIANTRLGKASEARENYNQALQLDPNDPYALMGMGLLAYRDTDFPTAADFFSRAVKDDPIDFHYLLLATALQKCDRQAEASAAYAQARRISSDWTLAQRKADWFLSN
jgi:tetratricopeptide (TPR) repeat protein